MHVKLVPLTARPHMVYLGLLQMHWSVHLALIACMLRVLSTTYNICREADAMIVTAEKPSMKTMIYQKVSTDHSPYLCGLLTAVIAFVAAKDPVEL